MTVHYRGVIGHVIFSSNFQARGLMHLPDEEGANIYLFHRDIPVDATYVERYNIISNTITTTNAIIARSSIIVIFWSFKY